MPFHSSGVIVWHLFLHIVYASQMRSINYLGTFLLISRRFFFRIQNKNTKEFAKSRTEALFRKAYTQTSALFFHSNTARRQTRGRPASLHICALKEYNNILNHQHFKKTRLFSVHAKWNLLRPLEAILTR